VPSRLPPLSVGTPDVDADPSMGTISDVSALLEKASSPLLRALPDFERQFLRNLKRYFYFLYLDAVYCCITCRSGAYYLRNYCLCSLSLTLVQYTPPDFIYDLIFITIPAFNRH
jgi:hypothetical protein